MNEGIHLDLDTWIVPGQIRTANLCKTTIIYIYYYIYYWYSQATQGRSLA